MVEQLPALSQDCKNEIVAVVQGKKKPSVSEKCCLRNETPKEGEKKAHRLKKTPRNTETWTVGSDTTGDCIFENFESVPE